MCLSLFSTKLLDKSLALQFIKPFFRVNYMTITVLAGEDTKMNVKSPALGIAVLEKEAEKPTTSTSSI